MRSDDTKRPYRVREGYWFAPKLFGFGATPATWQGWALTLAVSAALMLDIRFMPARWEKVIVGLALAAAFTIIAAHKTDGGWHWRWGSGD